MVDKMFDSRKKNPICNFSEEIVSYIYNEMIETEKVTFETHLSVCSKCVDKVAAFSSVSFSIQEWRDTEFSQLVTPQIDIPYQSEIISVDTEKEKSWLDNIPDLFTLSPVFIKTSMAFGVLALVFGMVWFFVNSNTNQENLADKQTPKDKTVVSPKLDDSQKQQNSEIAKDENNDLENDSQVADKKTVKTTPALKQENKIEEKTVVKTNQPDNNSNTNKQTIRNKQVKQESNPLIANKENKLNQNKENNLQIQEVPRLSNVAIDDTEEKDLRLSDLFVDVDSDR